MLLPDTNVFKDTFLLLLLEYTAYSIQMTKEEIEQIMDSVYSSADYKLLFKRASESPDVFFIIWEMIKERPTKKSWRLLWILDHATEKSNRNILPILDGLHQMVLNTDNESFIRIGMKLILRCPVNEDYAGELLERSVEWMYNQKSNMSTQVMGLEYFYRVCQIYPEMKPELMAHVDEMAQHTTSAGVKSRLRQIRKHME